MAIEYDAETVRVALTSGDNAGQELTFWTAVEIARGLDHCSSSFSVAVGRGKMQEAGFANLPVKEGDSVTVLIGDDPVITGHIDKVKKSRTAEAHGVNIQGRSVSADLIDCSATNSPGQWTGARMETILKDLVKEFHLPVVSAAEALGAVPNFEIEQGDTVFEAIERLARFRGLVVHDSPLGAVKIVRPGLVRALASLRHRDGPDGKPDPDNNVLESEFTADMSKRFSQVTVKGQGEGGKSKAGAKGEARDLAVPRHRPLIVKAESEASNEYCLRRARWECARRAGKAMQLTHTVKGWRQIAALGTGMGPLWDVDLLVRVDDDVAEVFRDMLVIDVKWTLDKNGRRTVLNLEPPEAWEPQPFMDKASGGAKWASVARAVQS